MPTDDEDLLIDEGSGSGDGDVNVVIVDDDDDDDNNEGSGIYYLSPTEIGALRQSFYEDNQVDLLRLDTTCQDRFIHAPQIFHAKIR